SELAYQPPPAPPVPQAAPVPQAPPAPPPPPEPQAEELPQPSPEPPFEPANDVEADLLTAASDGQTDTFLSTLLLARVLLPVAHGTSTSVRPGDPGFEWRREQVDGLPYVVVFTSYERMAERLPTDTPALTTKFVQLIRVWPDESWSFAVNPGSPVGATLPGGQIQALAAWAAEVGLSDEPSVEFEPIDRPKPPPAGPVAERAVVMQKPVAPTQVAYFLERGYDRVSGFVHRASEVSHLTTPEQLYAALGLGYAGSPFKPSDDEVYVLRWTAYRPNLYRIPYGGRDEAGMRAMQGWMIERSPFRGNGFAPGESDDVIAEFKVDSARLPHNAQMWRITRDGTETLVALLDADGPRWVQVVPGDTGGEERG
ncbi:MAG TPA: SseB family protein, partial [Rugosimonospora sp.]|nr:SseB family protein [Rugosimonospora sp.]